jgi:hypothetical protein
LRLTVAVGPVEALRPARDGDAVVSSEIPATRPPISRNSSAAKNARLLLLRRARVTLPGLRWPVVRRRRAGIKACAVPGRVRVAVDDHDARVCAGRDVPLREVLAVRAVADAVARNQSRRLSIRELIREIRWTGSQALRVQARVECAVQWRRQGALTSEEFPYG